MAQTQLSDVIVPAEFSAYQAENSLLSTALYQSGVAVPNGEMQSQLQAGAQSFAVPFWSDLPDVEADITNASSNRTSSFGLIRVRLCRFPSVVCPLRASGHGTCLVC
jgi:hypothetical protein